MLGLLVTLSGTIGRNIEREIIDNFEQQQKALNQMHALVYDRLVESCYLIGENPAFKANVSLMDPSTIGQSVVEFAGLVKVDLLIVTDPSGRVLGALDRPELIGQNIENKPGMLASLSGNWPHEEFSQPILWNESGVPYQIVSAPLQTNNEFLGTITLGAAITDFEAEQLKTDKYSDVHVVHSGKIVASTMDTFLRKGVERVLPDLRHTVSSEQTHLLDTEFGEYYLTFGKISDSEDFLFATTNNKKTALKLWEKLKDRIWLIGIATLILTFLFSSLLGNGITKPLLRMVSAFQKVGEGNLNINIAHKSTDELGILANSFNTMVQGLRERANLQKYVGDHTREVVKLEGIDKPKKIKACVLFSDLRGFSKMSGTMEPERVIQILNNALGFQAKIVYRYSGIIDKFVGDELMAIFRGEKSVQRAVSCAIDIQKKSKSIEDFDLINIGIGINYGDMVLGNIGIRDRMDFTVVGATVNLAANLCSIAGRGESLILKSLLDKTVVELNQEAVELKVKGYNHPLEVINLTPAKV